MEKARRTHLAEGRGGQAALSVVLERPEVVLQAGDQRDMPDAAAGPQRVKQVAHHGSVDTDVLRLSGLALPGGDENMGGTLLLQPGLQPGRVEQVGRKRLQRLDVLRRAPRQVADLPALAQQAPGQIVAHDAADLDQLGLRPRSRRRRFTRSGSGRVGAGTGRARERPPLLGTIKPPDPVRHGRGAATIGRKRNGRFRVVDGSMLTPLAVRPFGRCRLSGLSSSCSVAQCSAPGF